MKLGNGLIVNDACCKIEQIEVNKKIATMIVGTFTDNENVIPINEKIYVFTPDMTDNSKNIFAQGYDYLKTHVDFKGANDA